VALPIQQKMTAGFTICFVRCTAFVNMFTFLLYLYNIIQAITAFSYFCKTDSFFCTKCTMKWKDIANLCSYFVSIKMVILFWMYIFMLLNCYNLALGFFFVPFKISDLISKLCSLWDIVYISSEIQDETRDDWDLYLRRKI